MIDIKKESNIKMNNLKERVNRNKKKVILFSIIFLILISLIIFANYKHIFGWSMRKTIDENNAVTVNYETNSNIEFVSYMDELLMFNNKKLISYNSSGKESWNYQIDNISEPLISANNNLLVISQKMSDTFNVFEKKDIKTTKKVNDGKIQSIYVNSGGYIAVVYSQIGYKTVIGIYKSNGEELFNIYLTSTNVSNVRISDDNKYICFSEIDTSKINVGTIVNFVMLDQSNDKYKQIVKSPLQENSLLFNMEFCENDKVACLFDNRIVTVNPKGEVVEVEKIDASQTLFVDIAKKYYVQVNKPKGLLGKNEVKIKDYYNKHTASFETNKQIKDIHIDEMTISLNYDKGSSYSNIWGGSIKTFDSTVGAKKIVLFNSNKNAAIILADRIYIIGL